MWLEKAFLEERFVESECGWRGMGREEGMGVRAHTGREVSRHPACGGSQTQPAADAVCMDMSGWDWWSQETAD